ncbi:MAG: LysM peptidoglycan-binding domain-containing protein [Chloroflexota bacterium]
MPQRPPELPISDEDWAKTPPKVQAFILSQIKPPRQVLQPQSIQSSKRRSAFRVSSLMLTITLAGIGALILIFALVSATQTCILHGGQLYKVQSGDTMFGLSLRYGVPVSTIAAANGISDANYLYVHQDIVIPKTYCAPSYLVQGTLTAEAKVTSDWLTSIPTAMPTTDLTKTTATPTSTLEPIYITATYIVERATQTEAAYMTATAITWTPAPTADLTRTTATPTVPIDPLYITATYIVGRATQTEAAYMTATVMTWTPAPTADFTRTTATPTPTIILIDLPS